MTKSPRKSLVSSFGLLSAEIGNASAAQAADPQQSSVATPSATRVGAGVISVAHRAIDDIRNERDRLKELLESGTAAIKELDPDIIDPSPFPDRLADDDASSFEMFKLSIAEEGQKVPIQVRKHPGDAGRYQVVYGHRRWTAAKQLGITVRALEVEISDADLVVAQGIENASRQDLTWIERALFASRMDDEGVKPRHIYAALSIEDAELARMRSVYRIIPRDLIEAIGRAPKIGRPRWMQLAKTLQENEKQFELARRTLANGPADEISDQRFQRLSDALRPEKPSSSEPTLLKDASGQPLGKLHVSPKELKLAARGDHGQAFLKFLEAELPVLAERFFQNTKP